MISAHGRNQESATYIMLKKRASLETLTALTTIIFDVENLLCLDGCCRLACLNRMLMIFYREDYWNWDSEVSDFYEGINVTIRCIWDEKDVHLVRKIAPIAKIEMRGDGQMI